MLFIKLPYDTIIFTQEETGVLWLMYIKCLETNIFRFFIPSISHKFIIQCIIITIMKPPTERSKTHDGIPIVHIFNSPMELLSIAASPEEILLMLPLYVTPLSPSNLKVTQILVLTALQNIGCISMSEDLRKTDPSNLCSRTLIICVNSTASPGTDRSWCINKTMINGEQCLLLLIWLYSSNNKDFIERTIPRVMHLLVIKMFERSQIK